MNKLKIQPDYLFEASWEVCNKVGGIYTVIATKALYMKSILGSHHIVLGPDVWADTTPNPDFTEDLNLYAAWRKHAAEEGLKVKVGRWNIPGEPVAILVDFKQFMPEVDSISGQYWESFRLDSITGRDDYKESLLFGHAAGRVIESFCSFNLTPSDKALAQFHEWQTGSGVLYLRRTGLPIATAFTTHATVAGRCLAGNDCALYNEMHNYNPDEVSYRFNVRARHSLESVAAKNADVFTTVSDITAAECEQFLKKVDIVTPNGFEPSFTPSTDEAFDALRQKARSRFMAVAEAMSGTKISEDALFIGIGGRYEYRNKGIDVFLDSLASLKNSGYSGRDVHAFVMIPSGHNGPDGTLETKLTEGHYFEYKTQVSHILSSPEYDRISNRCRDLGLNNVQGTKVFVYFIPSYLNGNDGIFNMKYYDLLPGLDLAIFPSYYEPWGYTPLEALAFRVPTLTTSLAGFGAWVDSHLGDKPHPGITVLRRDDSNYAEVVAGVVERIREISSLSPSEHREYMDNALEVASIALWKNLLEYYLKAYQTALENVVRRCGSFPESIIARETKYEKKEVITPNWKSVMVTRHLPKALAGLEELSMNLWWNWNEDAKELFVSIDPKVWQKSEHNPRYVLDKVSIDRFNELAKDKEYVAKLDVVMKEFHTYMDAKKKRTDPSVAYFCMEYGLESSLKIYSGGLGILAGDYLKETSDMNVNLCAVGFLYRYGYFTQVLSAQGEQIAYNQPQDFGKLPCEPIYKDGEWLTVTLPFPGREVSARLWKVAVGRTDLYLLDTDYEANLDEDRQITHHLYGGDWENRLKQELLLGIGGIKALRALGIKTQVYHCNEGHAAFVGLERLRELIQEENLAFPEAMEVIRASSLFTTHTPVPAGHDAFDEGLLRKYIHHVPEQLKIDWETLMSLGKMNPTDISEKFSMSTLAANISQEVNGVSMLHGKVSQDIFAYMYPGYLPEENHVSYVTNGVHYPSWCAKLWKEVHATVFGEEFKTHHYDKSCFEGIYKVSDEKVWDIRKQLKHRLIETVKSRLADPSLGNYYSPRQVVKISETLREDVLTIGFARRFATYKRATLLFSDLDRLDSIVNNPSMPVQFLFAGKAHPADKAGQDLIKQIVEISKMPQFLGKIVFVAGYDIELAKRLVQGVDVWMNNPTRPQEASGTSGEKAAMNGVMHFSVLDGWWVEGYRKDAGWALPQERTYDDQSIQNDLDSATIYAILENDIAPTYYNKSVKTGLSSEWIAMIKNTIAHVASNFTTNRMLTDYLNQYYIPQGKRSKKMIASNYKQAREIAAWKKNFENEWKKMEVVSCTMPEQQYVLTPGSAVTAEAVLNLAGVSAKEVGVEILFAMPDKKGVLHIADKKEYEVKSFKDGIATYTVSVTPPTTGMYQVGVRVFPKNALLPHRQDFGLVKWL